MIGWKSPHIQGKNITFQPVTTTLLKCCWVFQLKFGNPACNKVFPVKISYRVHASAQYIHWHTVPWTSQTSWVTSSLLNGGNELWTESRRTRNPEWLLRVCKNRLIKYLGSNGIFCSKPKTFRLEVQPFFISWFKEASFSSKGLSSPKRNHYSCEWWLTCMALTAPKKMVIWCESFGQRVMLCNVDLFLPILSRPKELLLYHSFTTETRGNAGVLLFDGRAEITQLDLGGNQQRNQQKHVFFQIWI